MAYIKTVLTEAIVVKRIVTVHYFEYAKDYIYEGEKHHFWEFLFVDKGEVEVMAGMQGYQLKQGEMIFHKPDEFHNFWANGRVAPNLIVVSFECNSPAMKYFEHKIIQISDHEKNLLAGIIREAREAFSSPLDDPALTKLEKKSNSHLGCEQLIKTYLEQLLISLIRKGASIRKENRLSSTAKERSEEDITRKIIHYLEDNIEKKLYFGDICRYSRLSGTNLKTIFKNTTGTSVMEYFNKLRIETAKTMIREGQYNITEIADKLGYTSVHYFSRRFKEITGMAPSEYASSVKVKI